MPPAKTKTKRQRNHESATERSAPRICIFCDSPNIEVILSLGPQPIANAFLTKAQLHKPETRYPLDWCVCEDCKMVQVPPAVEAIEIFTDGYHHKTSYSKTALDNAEDFVTHVVNRFDLDRSHLVMQIGSNDGYLLQYFLRHNIYALGIESAPNIAEAAREKGVDTQVGFWSRELSQELTAEGRDVDFLIANNVLTHTYAPNDFMAGIKHILKPQGIAVLEFPHLYRMVDQGAFDTIFHEHFAYFAAFTMSKLLATHGLALFDIDEIDSHGGSLRAYVTHEENEAIEFSHRVRHVIDREADAGMMDRTYYTDFAELAQDAKRSLLRFLIDARNDGKRVAAYGAPARGNTLLNYCGIQTDRIAYTVDRNPDKQGLYLPGSRLPIFPPDHILQDQPDYVVILPWHIQDEIIEQMQPIRDWGGQFVVPIPEVSVI